MDVILSHVCACVRLHVYPGWENHSLYRIINMLPPTYRAKERASHDAENQKRAERQAEFEALPEWKKKLIKQRKPS